MPTTFMNESGKSIRATLNWFDLNVNQLIVLVDDIDLPLGRLRLRTKGSSGGHNGLKSTINHLGTQDFCRIRIGVGNPITSSEERRMKIVSHVLGNFSAKETEIVDEVLQEVIKGLEVINTHNLEIAGNRINAYRAKDFIQK